MTMTRLIVKGTREVAMETARSFGLEVEWQHATRFGEQVLRVVADAGTGAVERWFHDEDLGGWHPPFHCARPAYPPGTLLWYRLHLSPAERIHLTPVKED